MKRSINKLLLFLAPALLALGSCKKNDTFVASAELDTKDYVYNVALKAFQPETTVKGTLEANFDVRTVYYYLQRSNKTDSLLQIDLIEKSKQSSSYAFEIKATSWTGVNFVGAEGVKVLFVRDNSTSVEKFIKLEYFDPAAPVITGLPSTLTPSLTGPVTVTGKVTSETGIQKIEIMDNNTGSFTVLETINPNGVKEYSINYGYVYKDGAGQMKIIVTDIYGLKTEKLIQFVGIPFKPVVTFGATTYKAALPDGVPTVSGTVKTYTAITELKMSVVKTSGETLLGNVAYTLTNSVPNEFTYSFTYTGFPFADDVTGMKLEAKDGSTGTGSSTVPVQILPYYHWKNVTMMAQGINTDPVITPTNCFFIGEQNKPVAGSCDVTGSTAYDAKIDFLAFATTTIRFTLYNPTNSTNIRTNYKCGANTWAPASVEDNKFRVMLTTSVSAGSNIYNKYNAGGIEDLSDAFFTGTTAPSASTAYYDGASAASSGIFDPVTAYLIWVKADGGTKNLLIRIRSVDLYASPLQGKSTAVMDVLKQR